MPALFVCVVVFAVFVSFGAFSQQSLREFESTSEFEKALAAVDAIKHRKKMQCVLAIPNWALCECLRRGCLWIFTCVATPQLPSKKRVWSTENYRSRKRKLWITA
jgi:hypothetical protein